MATAANVTKSEKKVTLNLFSNQHASDHVTTNKDYIILSKIMSIIISNNSGDSSDSDDSL